MATNSDFRTLLLKVISGDISGEDKALFYDMVLTDSQEEELKNVLKELGEERAALYVGYEFKPGEWTEIKNGILKRETSPAVRETSPIVLLKDRTFPEAHIRKMPVRRLSWIAAAASVLLFIGLGFYLKNIFKPKAETAAANKQIITNDIAPGSNKAILYLANGKQIILDSANNGQLASLGNVNVIKTDSGKLVYTSSENGASGSKSSKSSGSEIPNGINELHTPRGGIYQLTLPDGTVAWLNAASSIIYPTRFDKKEREVKISGEVYFEVAKDASHPFVVSLAAITKEEGENGHWMQVRVLGTHFNINDYADDNEALAKTTLLEGSVQITAHGKNKIIKPGEQAATSYQGKSIDINQQVDLEKVMAWKNGEMVLSNGDVQQLMREISRWYDVDIQYAGTVPNKKFYGSVNRNVPLSSVLNVLKAYGIETKLEGKKIIVL